MKKKYKEDVNKRNTPNLELYTWIIGISYSAMSINMIIGYLYSKDVNSLNMGIMFAVITPVVVTDRRKELRGGFYAASSAVVLVFVTLLEMCYMSLMLLGLILVVEISLEVIAVIIYTYRNLTRCAISNKVC